MTAKKITRKDFLKKSAAGLGALMLQTTLATARATRLGAHSTAAAARANGNGAESQGKRDRPNILFITMDQLRSLPDIPPRLPLPALRGLQKESRNFQNYYVHQAPCGPSRSTFYTGQHIQKTGMYTNPTGEFGKYTPEAPHTVELRAGFPTLGTMLREQGYYTAYKGKWHLSVINQKLGKDSFPNATKALEPYGFSDYNYDGEHTGLTWAGFGHDGVTAAESIDLLERFAAGGSGGKPWFLAVNFVNPHDIMFFDARDQGSALFGMPLLGAPGAALYEKNWHFDLPRSYRADDLSTKPAVQRPQRPLTEAQLRTYQNYYFNCIRDVDQHVGSVLDALVRLGFRHNTVVVVTADHGELAGAHGGMLGKGASIYKENLRVPLMIRHPDVRRAGASRALVGGIDLAPTLLAFAGLSDADRAQRYPDLRGVDISAAVADQHARTARDERGILFNYATPPGVLGPNGPTQGNSVRGLIRGVFDGRYKLARYFRLTEHHQPRDWQTLLAHNDLELYDTEQDADEIVNLAFHPEAHQAKILQLNTQLNTLIDAEIGVDDGSMYPGPASQYALG
jgi:arylsulfatase A-like enzyme